MTLGPDTAIHIGWLGWLVSWMAAAGWKRQTIKRLARWSEAAHLAPTVLGFGMLFSTHAPLADPSRQVLNNPQAPIEPIQLWSTPLPAGWLLFALTLAGYLFCWWARVHLGRLWSGSVTLKPDHRVVDTGPYRLVRHPIYTGLILSALATAAEKGTVLGLAGFASIVLGFWIKAKFEEGFLRQELGREAYDSYAARTPMLVPTRL